MKNTFSLKEKQNIVIYGAGNQGERIADLFASNGYKIDAIIDRCALEFNDKSCDFPIITQDEFAKEKKHYDDILVITLNNGLTHEKIALDFYNKYNMDKIVFLPMHVAISDEKKHILRKTYKDLLGGAIPQYDLPKFILNDTYIKIIDDTYLSGISLWYPVNKIYTLKQLRNKKVSKWFEVNKEKRAICDLPLTKVDPYLKLFKYLDGENVDVSSYLALQGCGMGRDEHVLMQQITELHEVFKKELARGTSFFTETCCTAKWDDENSKVRILDGYHRAHFLIRNGFREIPIWLPKKDYQLMCDFLRDEEKV